MKKIGFVIFLIASSVCLFSQSSPGLENFRRAFNYHEGNNEELIQRFEAERQEIVNKYLSEYPDLITGHGDYETVVRYFAEMSELYKRQLLETLCYLDTTEGMLNATLLRAQELGYNMTHELIYELIKTGSQGQIKTFSESD
jgi:hypothetical protein